MKLIHISTDYVFDGRTKKKYTEDDITNPLNKTEIFQCGEIYSDYRRCKGMFKKGLKTKAQCREIRHLGQTCYMSSAEEFEKHLVRIFEEKRNYIEYLKKEGSILYNYYKSDPTVFSIKKLEEDNYNCNIEYDYDIYNVE